MTFAVPEVVAVNVALHVPTKVPDRMHPVKDPVTPVSLRATVPDGAIMVPGELSVTVTLHVEPWFATTGELHVTTVIVSLGFSTMLVVPWLPPCVVSPG